MNPSFTRVRHLTTSDFDTVRELVSSACGIRLEEQKKVLVCSRLEGLVHHYRFSSYTEYIDFIARRKHGAEFIEFIDTLTTNHSGFWREPQHFAFLQTTVFPAKRNRIRIWSAGCATGEEPYTIAMCALDAGIQGSSIAATDISRTALAAARAGVYSSRKAAVLPSGFRQRYLIPAAGGAGLNQACGISSAARGLVHYNTLNLLHPFPHMGRFDVIFCRNVMIYFDQATRDRLIDRLADQLTEGGYLFTGHSETLLRPPPALQYVQPATYRKVR